MKISGRADNMNLFATSDIPAPLDCLVIRRVWEMPSKWTFKMQCIQELFKRYGVGLSWADPFAGMFSPAEISNDIEGRTARHQMDALDFLKQLPDDSASGVLFDPPYSVEQCLRKYTPKHNGTAGRAEYWARCKDEIGRIVRPGGMAISFCWDSTGIGKKRGFEIIEILLICHGACHNDTIVTVDRKAL
ncbi:MAG TPA: adenine-specific DNA methylase [Candidatus Wunengus sp. YC61]|uniref:adenine-specific DNA methylase n=1 Tax=Candidatus Wunengus sp. YC61 TaxID=3367698 RepID=UPI0040272F9C